MTDRLSLIIKAYNLREPGATAQALREHWLEFDTNRGIELVKAEQRQLQETIGIPIPELKVIGKEIARPACKNISNFIPLARLLWDQYGREGRVVSLIVFGAMQLVEPDRIIPILKDICRSCFSWEDADRLSMDTLEPIVRKHPDRWLGEMETWLIDENKWVRRAAVTVVGRLPMKDSHVPANDIALQIREHEYEGEAIQRPAIVFPLHDPEGWMFPHLETITPLLKQLFAIALMTVTPPTAEQHPAQLERLEKDPFFKLFPLSTNPPVGEHFVTLFQQATGACAPNQVMHLCFVDRLAFILQSQHQDGFIEDIRAVAGNHTPLLFQRSKSAWATHPANYSQIEGFATTVGEFLFGQTLDFAWCHLAIQGSHLKAILPQVKNHDMSVLAEITLLIRDSVHTKDVGWLAWEDPFILQRQAAELKNEREKSAIETQKRLAYLLPVIQKIMQAEQP